MALHTLTSIEQAPHYPRVINPLEDPRWQPFVLQHPSGSIFHSQEWLRVLAKTYDFQVEALVLEDHRGVLVAALPYVRVNDLRGTRVRTLPFCDYCDPLVSTLEQWQDLTRRLFATGEPYLIRCVFNDVPLSDPRLTLSSRARWHKIDLTPDVDTLWERLDGGARRAIRKARNTGVETFIATNRDEVRHFFNLHLGIRKNKYRLLAQPLRFFEHIWDELIAQGMGAIMFAVQDGELVGSVMYLYWKDSIIYKFSTSSLAHQAVRPTDLMIWEGIQLAKSRNLTGFDFGLTDWDQEGLIRFKQKFATEERTISFLSANPDQPPPTLAVQQVNQMLPQLTDLMTAPDVPDELTRQVGDLIYGYFA